MGNFVLQLSTVDGEVFERGKAKNVRMAENKRILWCHNKRVEIIPVETLNLSTPQNRIQIVIRIPLRRSVMSLRQLNLVQKLVIFWQKRKEDFDEKNQSLQNRSRDKG